MPSASGELNGFVCPKCKKVALTRCIDSRHYWFGIKRRRECEFCGERFSTVEIMGDAIQVEKFYESMEKEGR